MAVTRTVILDGKPLPLMASGMTPRLYRQLFGKDVFADMAKLRRLRKAVLDNPDGGESETGEPDMMDPDAVPDEAFTAFSSEMYENLAFCMAKMANPALPDKIEDWLASIDDPSGITLIAKDVLKLYYQNARADVKPMGKKKHGRRRGK